MLRVAAVLVAMGFAVACDTDEELSAEELELLEADLSDTSDDELANETQGGEPNVGADGPIDALAADREPVAFTWLAWHSEESPDVSKCPPDTVVTGFDCDGAFCDNVRIECHDYGTSIPDSSWGWSSSFEFTGKSFHICPAYTKMTALDCWGSYCDNLMIRCSYAPDLAVAAPCEWTQEWYSEETSGPIFAPVGSAIQGIECSGNHCDNKRFCIVNVP